MKNFDHIATMQIEKTDWSYNEFLAFVMIYAAEMNYNLSADELNFIMEKTGVTNIHAIKARVDSLADADCIEIIDNYKKTHLSTPERKLKAKRDLEGLLKTPGQHSQLEKVAVHIIEKLF